MRRRNVILKPAIHPKLRLFGLLFQLTTDPTICSGLSPTGIYKFDGNTNPNPFGVRHCSTVIVEFYSDFSVVGAGFGISYSTASNVNNVWFQTNKYKLLFISHWYNRKWIIYGTVAQHSSSNRGSMTSAGLSSVEFACSSVVIVVHEMSRTEFPGSRWQGRNTSSSRWGRTCTGKLPSQ